MKKCLVYFGSFNPLTNAHVGLMKTAMDSLGCDMGLFVATNGKYLQSKMSKHGEAFALSEDERKDMIVDACKEYNNIGFWGFELGGYSPNRYKTMLKIKRENPELELIELLGADKIRSIAKSAKVDEYVGNTQFAVVGRDDIDVSSLIETSEVLSKYKDHFALLPSLVVDGDVSSTKVRKCFFDGTDYSSMVPSGVVKVLSRHTPEDFTISYEDEMRTIIGSSRFGINTAGKKVYNENREMFLDWKNGLTSFGDYQEYLDNTKHYSSEYSVSDIGTVYPTTETGCMNIDCVDFAQHLIGLGYNPAILNLASAGRAGGGYDRGLHAQEESLCQCSTLSLSLYQFADHKKLKCARDSGVPSKFVGYPFDMNFGGIYTPNVTFFRNNSSKYYGFKKYPFTCDVITVAALSFNGRNDYSRAMELQYHSADDGFTPDGEEIMLNKIRTIFRMGVEHGKDALILGAFGCGAYKLPVEPVAKLFKRVMNEPEFANKFRLITFAILESRNRPNRTEGKFAPFYAEFGDYLYADFDDNNEI